MAAAATMLQRQRAHRTCCASLLLAVPYHHATLFAYAQLSTDVGHQGLDAAELWLVWRAQRRRHCATAARPSARTMPFCHPAIAAQFGTLSNGYNAPTGVSGTAAAPTQTLTIGTINLNNLPGRQLRLSAVCKTRRRSLQQQQPRPDARRVHPGRAAWATIGPGKPISSTAGVRERQKRPNDSLTRATISRSTRCGSRRPTRARRACRSAASSAAPLLLGNPGGRRLPAAEYLRHQHRLATGPFSTSIRARIPNSGILDNETIALNQDVLAGSMQGMLPWGLPAGPVAVAFGARISPRTGRRDPAPIRLAPAGQWAAGNFVPYRGQYHVEEGFLEIDAPHPEGQYRPEPGFQCRGPHDQLFHQRAGRNLEARPDGPG